ncbi:hypothetical protein CVIRNUC_007851 [Coccomyxa viridis]|uniref:Serine-threonine/tyrosine-protein kinase catalytic domain-containing protein n=1 Tax=Coccomyxa viridis TaxID=1274662 RepID=A0AAV1IEN4_9CHLO|nr:hypothetical protein CVIRNUC_007851 [Coccomyxa viridis]
MLVTSIARTTQKPKKEIRMDPLWWHACYRSESHKYAFWPVPDSHNNKTLEIGQDCLKVHFVRLRVPEECPLAIANLYTACTMARAEDRPSASAIVRSLEDAVPSPTGAEDP